jgi:type VI secretion system protein
MKNILLVFLVLINIACAELRTLGQSKLVMKVNVSPQANNNNPVALDLVLVKDKKLLQELMKISAKEWFEKRTQYRLGYSKETGLSFGSWEWVPGQVVKIEPMPLKSKFAGGIIFANYFTPGAHRALIDLRKSVVVNLGAEEITVTLEK